MKTNLFRGMSALFLIGAAVRCDALVGPNYPGEPLVTLRGHVEALERPSSDAEVGVLWFTDENGECTGPQKSCSFSGSTGANGDQVNCLLECGEMPDCADAAAMEVWKNCQEACGADVQVESRVEYQACFTGAVAETAPVDGDFPAQFELDMLLPPPPAALLSSDSGERLALGYFVALAPGSSSLTLSLESDEPPAWLLGGSESHVLVYAADPIPADSSWGVYLGGSYDVGYHLVHVAFGTRCGLARLHPDSASDPTTDSTGVAYSDLDESAPPGQSQPMPEPEPSYEGEPFVCGNAVCEAGEDCSTCSDCTGCTGGSPGVSSGNNNLGADYHCQSTPDRLEKSPPGSEGDIQLLLLSPRLIAWPDL